MARTGEEAKVVAAVERLGALLVYPIAKRADVPSLWSVLYPRSEMRWAWDADADPRVSSVWILREQIARSRKVVYSKWNRGRAVFFSHALLTAMLAVRQPFSSTCWRVPDAAAGCATSRPSLTRTLPVRSSRT